MEQKKLCVIGDPVEHSLSPVIHNTILRHAGLPYEYGRVQVKAGDTEAFLRRAVREGYAGFNATMPHKTALVKLADELDADAKLYRAVNTVVLREGKIRGCNTDGRGFLQMLAESGISPQGRTVLVLGAGGAARAIVLKLAQSGAARIFVCNRTLSRAEALELRPLAAEISPRAEALAEEFPAQITACPFDQQTLSDCALFSDLLINTTPMGMTAVADQFDSLAFLEQLPGGVPVCDIIYSPPETPLLCRAKELGHPTMNGLGMLIYQAIFALEEFTGTEIDAAAMMPSVKAALREAMGG